MAGPYRPKPARKPGGRKPDPQLQKKDENELNINGQITAPQVRLVGDNIPEPGIVPISRALQLADQLELDLVEISAKADPPVCKILDYQKYLYQQRKKAKEMKSNAAKVVIKEIRFGPNTDEHDFQFKLKHAQEFLQEGSKVKASIFFRGRSIMFADQGEKQLLRFAVELEPYGRAENMPTLEGKRMTMMLAPLKKKSA
ncbi:MAG: translation initiation factor IF-3 [Bacteroidales bacterium]|jgi:translation initiation factor IF-3|nr:translation initiation factor IF-3 [Bacteroidales bacterium]